MDPHIETLYQDAARTHTQVGETASAYHRAVAARTAAFRALRAVGESAQAIGRRIGISRSRVAQIVAEKEKP
jgi:uncharacterized protein YdbL (DUF1318 family)